MAIPLGARRFHHPYEPYDIQIQFMTQLYDCIEEGKVGIFESPTGTGKSLSLICGSLTWLREHKKNVLEDQLQVKASSIEEPEWVVEHARERKKQEYLRSKVDEEARLTRIRAREKRQKERFESGESRSKRTKADIDQQVHEDDSEARFLLDEYDSDDDVRRKETKGGVEGLSTETQALMKSLGMTVSEDRTQDDNQIENDVKVYYCSRTHSQLTQFAQELRRVQLPSSMPELLDSGVREEPPRPLIREGTKYVTLGSRKNLCINDKVSKLASATAVTERCLELQQPNTAKESKCCFLPRKENESLVNDFRDHVLAEVRDIEDLHLLGKKLGVCPYYASRSSISPSEIVTLPYPLLLQKSAREALGISLKGHVVIIDEAHNLMDAIANLHSVDLSLKQLRLARSQLFIYLQKFRNRLKGKNRLYVTQTVRVLDSLANYLQEKEKSPHGGDGIVLAGDLMSGKGVDQVNLYKLIHYLQDSKLARKVDGYSISIAHLDAGEARKTIGSGKKIIPQKTETTTPVLNRVQDFLLALTNPSTEGRIFYENLEDEGVQYKYMLLDPTNHFRDVVEEARAVILAGGTMSPMTDYTNHLFNYVDPTRMQTLSCGHVIPAQNLLALPLSLGIGGSNFDFTFEKRNSGIQMSELGRTISALCGVIPDGLVVFFPSYKYLDQVVQHWRSSQGADRQSIWIAIERKKKIFLESKEYSGADETLRDFSHAIDGGNGGLLLSVVGGKMSEGINFSDRLGRGVIVVGLPFPNIHSAEWKAKLGHLEKSFYERSASESSNLSESCRRAMSKSVARDFYENTCMRAVNQSIGRAIRHRNDYAVIILVDRRYAGEKIQSKLPTWIKKGIDKRDMERSFQGRGHVSAGHGRVGKHRKHPGGRGMAGGQHHHRTNIDKYHPGYFGKVGMRYFHKLQNGFWRPVVNLDKLWSLVPLEQREAYLKEGAKKSDEVPVLDLLPLGYAKVLGKGRLPEVPIVVRARYFSKLAEKKIKEAGGAVELVA
ncbi:MAG: hypothetical protein M1825_004199 [Sarcosagium campestre]|nr:MAG: hypothetical protein M1825_004199 [Sarcosagium campestre]